MTTPIQIAWADETHTIIRMEFVGRWNWNQAYEAAGTGYEMLETVDHVVYVIIDISQAAGMPVLAMTNARNMIAKRHPRTGLTVFVGVNSLFLTLWKAFVKAYPQQLTQKQQFAFASSGEEALKLFAARSSATLDSA